MKKYNYYKVKVENLKEKLKALEDVPVDISYNCVKVDSGFENTVENNMITRIYKKSELLHALKIVQANINIIDRALKNLSLEERQILTAFYVERIYNPADRMAAVMNTSRTNTYNIRDEALRKIAIMISTKD